MPAAPLTLALASEVYSAEDFTYFIALPLKGPNVAEFEKIHPRTVDPKGREDTDSWLNRFDSWEGRIRLIGETGKPITGRATVAKCYGGGWLSITIRNEDPKKGRPVRRALSSRLPWLPKPFDAAKGFAAGQRELGEAIFALLPAEESSLHGLVVIAGATGCLKSEISRHLICQVLPKLKPRKDRCRHLVTLEDPIEKRLVKAPTVGRRLGIDYTPRALGRVRKQGDGESVRDCRNLAEGLRNALRMTPSAFYIGETRDQEDWKEVLKFAGSGHFALTTTHAGSLDETFQNILRAVGAVTPAGRAAVADKLIAVIHLASIPIEIVWPGDTTKREKTIVLPQLWRRTPSSAAGLVVDGLSSIQPTRTALDSASAKESCLARVSFVRPLLENSWGKNSWESADASTQLSEAELQILQYELSCV